MFAENSVIFTVTNIKSLTIVILNLSISKRYNDYKIFIVN